MTKRGEYLVIVDQTDDVDPIITVVTRDYTFTSRASRVSAAFRAFGDIQDSIAKANR